MKLTYRQILAMFFVTTSLVVVGCDDQGPAERAGEKIDEAVEEMGDKLDREGPMEKFGESLDNAMENTQDKIDQSIEKAGDKIEEMGDEIEKESN